MSTRMTELGIERLSVPERLELMLEIWESIAGESGGVPLTDAQRTQLERRLSEHEAHPDDVVTWDEVKADARARHRQ